MDPMNDDLLVTSALLEVTMTGPDPLVSLAAAGQVLRTLSDEVDVLAFNARAEGATWADIGEALAMTKQAAQQRFGRDEPAT
jgi:hypothetical protein